MQGLSRREEEDTERIINDRRTAERGSLARGERLSFLDGGCCQVSLEEDVVDVVARDDFAWLVRET
jgi:hypothetical protein